MTRDSRYDLLFESVRIGPLTAKNRFYQVPYGNGAGYRFPHTQAAMRGMRAVGGWAAVNTDWCTVHPSSDTTPRASACVWTDEEVRTNALMTEAVHCHDALAGCELAHTGSYAHNRLSRPPSRMTAKALELRNHKKSIRQIASEVGVSTATVQRELKKVA